MNACSSCYGKNYWQTCSKMYTHPNNYNNTKLQIYKPASSERMFTTFSPLAVSYMSAPHLNKPLWTNIVCPLVLLDSRQSPQLLYDWNIEFCTCLHKFPNILKVLIACWTQLTTEPATILSTCDEDAVLISQVRGHSGQTRRRRQ